MQSGVVYNYSRAVSVSCLLTSGAEHNVVGDPVGASHSDKSRRLEASRYMLCYTRTARGIKAHKQRHRIRIPKGQPASSAACAAVQPFHIRERRA